ncbi:unnamed protein product [Paramecium pentaurelia]|uniref:Regulator of chromosome condensation 1/beta-lactamase-inhibitor protein II n=1 Tax=Paramecium pentaurelia TaxID=43138 RepID=A0A8S1TTZ9_9CILI|nr:unnamed protein product [Paramecium pentaurelia]
MTHVLYFGVGDFALQMQTIMNDNQKLQRIVFPQNKYSRDPAKTSKKGEQELCFISVICCEQNTFLIDSQYDLWGFGNSQFAQLGLQQPSVSMPVNISQITQNSYKLVNAGTGFVVAYSTNKKIYVWGNWHQLNYGEVLKLSEKQGFTEQIDTFYQISSLDITYNFSINRYNEYERRSSHLPVHQAEVVALKCVGTITYLLTPNKLFCLGLQQQFTVQFIGIACGQKHILAWDDQGKVWSWGEFADGKLGYMDFIQKEQLIPKLIEDFSTKIVSCACGSNYSIALDVKGDIYGWGKGPFQMDLSKAVIPAKLCQKQKPFIKIMAGDSHFGALDLSGQLYGWGINTKNCLGDLDDKVRYPQLLELKNVKVIDAAMGNTFTVLIVPANSKYKLPSLNVDQYTSHQQKRVREEAAFMKDFADKKNKIDQIQAQTQIQQFCDNLESPLKNTQYEQTAGLLRKMKSQVDSLKGAPKNKWNTKSLRLDTDIINYHTQVNQDYDDVQSKLKQLEYQNYLYIPVCNTSTPTSQTWQQHQDIDQLLSHENDVLKYQYILMVKSQDESKFMKTLLNDNNKQSFENQNNLQIHPRSSKNRSDESNQSDKKKYHDKFDQFDPYFLHNVKRDLKQLSQKRKEIFIKKQKLREELNKEITEKMQLKKVPIQNKEDIIKAIQTQAYEREMKLRIVQQKKQCNFVEKIHHIQQQIQEKSPEFRYKKRLEIIRQQQNIQFFRMILTYLNMENIYQMMQDTSQRGLELKRLMFKEHMKARVIQNTIRKRNIIKKIKQKLGLRQKKILLSFIFRFKIHFRIKSKYTHIRKINLFHLRSSLFLKFRINLKTIVNKTQTIQRFCKWYNHNFQVQLSYLNYKWDEYLKQSFKGQMTEKDREELKLHELPHLMEKQQHILQKLITPQKSQNWNDLKLKINPVFKATELRTNLLKKVKAVVQIDEEIKDIDPKIIGRVLLPYTRYIDNIALSVAAKIRFDYQMMIQLQVHEKVYMEELVVKYDILKEHLEKIRREYTRQMRDFYTKLNDYKETHKQQINTDRGKLMIRFKADGPEIKQLKAKDDQEIKQILQKRELSRRRNGLNSVIFKDLIFNKIRQLPQDQQPFPNLILKLAENMCSDIRPKFKLRLTQSEWSRLFNQYQLELKQRYLAIMNEARKAAALRTKHLKQNKLIKKKRNQKTEQ